MCSLTPSSSSTRKSAQGLSSMTPPCHKSSPTHSHSLNATTTTTTTPCHHHHQQQQQEDSPPPKPFFIMDWLEEMVADQDIEKIAQLLKTPSSSSTNQILSSKNNHHNRNEPSELLLDDDASTTCPSTPKASNCKRPSTLTWGKKKPPTDQCHHQRARSESPLKARALFLGNGATKQEANNDTNHPQESTLDLPASSATVQPSPPPPKMSIFKKSVQLANGWNTKGLQKAQRGLWQDALKCWDNALEIRLNLLGRNHLDVANTYNNRGIALGKLGQYDDALEALQMALEVRLSLLHRHQQQQQQQQLQQHRCPMDSKGDMRNGHDTEEDYHSQVVSTLHNIANVHQQAGKLQLSLEVFGQARELLANRAAAAAATRGDYRRGNSNLSTSCAALGAKMQMALICVAIGHVYYQARQWVDARDAYQDATQLYLQVQKEHLEMQEEEVDDRVDTNNKGNTSSSILSLCQQELANLRCNMEELDQFCEKTHYKGNYHQNHIRYNAKNRIHHQ